MYDSDELTPFASPVGFAAPELRHAAPPCGLANMHDSERAHQIFPVFVEILQGRSTAEAESEACEPKLIPH